MAQVGPLQKATVEDIARALETNGTRTDAHKVLATRIFHVPYEEVTADQRKFAKARNFAAIYRG